MTNKALRSLSNRRWRDAHPEYSRLWRQQNAHKVKTTRDFNRSRARDLLAALKAKPCADCGGRFDPVCMDFDHRPGETKKNDVSKMLDRVDAMIAEIAKCDLVCANCHRLRTKKRMAEHEAGKPSEQLALGIKETP